MQNLLNIRSQNVYQFSSFQFTHDLVFLSFLLSANMAAGQLASDPGINNAQGIQCAVM